MAVKKKKVVSKKVSHISADVATNLVDIREARNAGVKNLMLALVCAVDDPKSWAVRSNGLAVTALPKWARIAAQFCSGPFCYFCHAAQEPIPADTLYHFQPEYPLCPCFLPLRQFAYDYIPDWHTPAGNKLLIEQAGTGALKRDAPVYQFMCDCGEGPNIVHVGRVVHALTMFKKHRKLTRCEACHRKQLIKIAKWEALQRSQFRARANPLKVPIQAIVEKPKTGPEGKITRDRKKKPQEKPSDIIEVVVVHTPIPEMTFKPFAALEAAPETPTT